MVEHRDDLSLEALTDFLYLVPVGLMQFGMDGQIEIANPLAAQLLMPMLPEQDFSDAFSALAPLLPGIAGLVRNFTARSGTIVDHAWCEVSQGGRDSVTSVTIHRMHEGANLALLEDVTQLVAQERQLRADRHRFRAIFEHVRDYAIFTVDAEGRIDAWNQSLRRFGDWSEADVLGQRYDAFCTPEPCDPAEFDAVLADARRIGSAVTEGWRLRADGRRFWANSVVTALPDAHGEVGGYVIVSRDMTEHRRVEDERRLLATTDPLTGAANRRQGQAQLAEVYRRAVGVARPGVLMLDVDFFKSINDAHGHAVGDLVLRAVADACRKALPADVPVIRWGGEEFLLLLAATTLPEAAAIAETLRLALHAVRVNAPGRRISITASIGVAVARGEAADILVDRAEAALYLAKVEGRDRVVVSEAE